MSKVITFSRVFPSYHPKAGQHTYFVEKIWESIYLYGDNPIWLGENYTRMIGLIPGLKTIGLHSMHQPKHHTIRSGHRWKAGDWFSPRVWSGKPYNSKQITIAPDIQIQRVWLFSMDEEGCFFLDGELFAYPNSDHVLKPLAENDGLEMEDLLHWFNKPFDGQIISWSDKIIYRNY